MAVLDSNTKAIIDAINALKGDRNQELEKEVRTLSLSIKTYIEKASAATTPAEAFKDLAEQLSSSIADTISSERAKQAKIQESTLKQILERREKIKEKLKDLKEQLFKKLESNQIKKL